MKLVRTEDAVGQVLCHDITQIIPGVVKDAVFRKGHIVTEEDIPVLLSVGKENLYIWEKQEGMLHENEAAEILRQICQGEHMHPSEVKEGKIELIADCEGVLKINTEKLNAVNSLGEMMIASRHGNFPVKTGDKIAGTRIIPLVIEEEKMQKACEVAGKEPIFRILPYQKKKAGIVTTGSEVYYHRIEDKFTPVVIEKLKECGVTEVKQIKAIVAEVKAELKEQGIPFRDDVEQGIMIETPAAAIISDELAKEVDFFSIGTNDLSQYTLAIDRQNTKLDPFFDPHHPAILRMIQMVVENAHKAGIWAGICGELGADQELTKEFLAMGVDELSVSPGSILPLRKIILETNVAEYKAGKKC